MSPSIQRLVRFIKENPDDLFTRFALALEMVKIGEDQKAKTLFESILQIQADYPGLSYHFGKLYQRLGALNEAESLFQQGVQFASEKGDLHTKNELLQALEELNAFKML